MGELVGGGAQLVLCADTTNALEQLEALVAPGGWSVAKILWPNERAALTEMADALAYVVESRDATEREALCAALAARGEGIPLVVVGANAMCGAQPSAWFADAPELVVPTLARLVGTDALGSARWRRKADMIIGHSTPTRQLLRALDQLAPAWTPVLITGESGVGKELVAQALHYCSPRAKAPFVVLNCAAIPESLIEAELFGYERGAFTGAVSSHDGAFAAAHGGTLFLDEIGEMPLAAQAKLLRVLETCEVQRIGSMERRKVQFRLVSATNRELEVEVAAGRFREDLYYRIHVVPLAVAPLRERIEDLPAIANHHLARISERERRPALRLTAEAIDKLIGHPWPGNVRELVNVLERGVLAAGTTVIDAEHLMLPTNGGRQRATGTLLPYRDAKVSFEHDYFSRLLKAASGNITLAAKLGGKTRKEIYDALRRLQIDAAQFREDD